MNFADAVSTYHLCDASVSEDVACVNEAVQHLGCLLDQVTLIGIILQLLICRKKTLWMSTFLLTVYREAKLRFKHFQEKMEH